MLYDIFNKNVYYSQKSDLANIDDSVHELNTNLLKLKVYGAYFNNIPANSEGILTIDYSDLKNKNIVGLIPTVLSNTYVPVTVKLKANSNCVATVGLWNPIDANLTAGSYVHLLVFYTE